MGGRGVFLATILGVSLAVACAPKAHPTAAEHGVATPETWLQLAAHGARIQVPTGWEFAQNGHTVAGLARDGRGGFSLSGAAAKGDAKEQLAVGLHELDIELGAPRTTPSDVVVHGIVFARQDFEATVHGEQAHVVVLAADHPPKGRGMLVFIGYALEGEDALRAAIASIAPG